MVACQHARDPAAAWHGVPASAGRGAPTAARVACGSYWWLEASNRQERVNVCLASLVAFTWPDGPSFLPFLTRLW